MHRSQRPAFTLIELLVVIAIMAIIAAILFPVFARARETARQASCLSNQKQIAAAVQMYMSDDDETFPFVLDFSQNSTGSNYGDENKHPVVPGVTGQEPQFQLVNVVAPYVKNTSVWYCPSVGPDFVWEASVKAGGWKPGATMRDQGTTYVYVYEANNRALTHSTFMGGKSEAILLEPTRWPMLADEPGGFGFSGNIADPPSSAAPHSGGLNLAYGDGHAKYHHLEAADGSNYLLAHCGDGLYAGQ